MSPLGKVTSEDARTVGSPRLPSDHGVFAHGEMCQIMERISLGNEEFEGRNNAYLFSADENVGLVDSGVSTVDAREKLTSGLATHGFAFSDIDDLVVTHWHPDHAGLAGEIQDAGNSRVHAHRADASLVAREPHAIETLDRLRRSVFQEWGIPEPELTELVTFLDSTDVTHGTSVEVTPFDGGDQLTVGGQSLQAIHTPGHAAGLCCFDLADGTLLSGDTVLPEYTPNIGGADPRVDAPLQTYLRSLQTLLDGDFDQFYPGHREPITDPADRIHEIISHHHDRTQRVIEVLRETGPADPWTVGTELFGNLSGIHIMHGPGEAHAHLDHLHNAGLISRTDGLYYPPDDSVEMDDLLA